MNGLFCLLLFITVLAENPCDDQHVLVTFEKKSGSYAEVESFTISKGTDVIYTSPSFEDHSYKIWNTCLLKSSNNTYLLTMQHSRQKRWDDQSYMVIRGEYGNIVFKNSMLRSGKDPHTFSLYYGLLLNSTVRFMFSTVPEDWKGCLFDDSSWQEINLGNPSLLYNGTQYFRSHFQSIPSSSSYELQLRYQYGIVVYLDGLEIFRDHLPEGPISETTLSTDQYDHLDFHGIIRPTSDFSSSSPLLCIEEHFPDTSSHSVTMNFWLAISLPTLTSLPCTVVPLSLALSSSPPLPALEDIVSLDLSTRLVVSSSLTLSIHFNSTTIPLINGIQFFSSYFPDSSPSSYSLFSTLKNHSLLHLQANHITNKPFEYSPVLSPLIHHTSYSYSLILPSSQSSLLLSQLQFLTCSLSYPFSIEFEHLYYDSMQYSPIHIRPRYTGFHDCSISPPLPEGLVMDPASCQIDGFLTKELPFTWFSVVYDMSLDGEFGLKVEKGYCVNGNDTLGINKIGKQSCERKQGAFVIGYHFVKCIVDNDQLRLVPSSNLCFAISHVVLGIIGICCVLICTIFLFYRIYIKNRLMKEDYTELFVCYVCLKNRMVLRFPLFTP